MDSKPVSVGRLTTFDAIRGIAALGVVLHHLLLSWNGPERAFLQYWTYYTPLEALFSGGKFVRIFFVISGFVLVLPFLKSPDTSLTQFYIRRAFRVWPPMALVAILAATVSLTLPSVGPIPGASAWLTSDMRPLDVTMTNLLQHLAMIGTDASIKLNCVTWSLVHEARIMVVFPLLVMAILRADLLTLGLSALASLIAAAVYAGVGETTYFATAETWPGALASSIVFLPQFVLGMVMAKRIDQLKSLLANRNLATVIVLWIVAFLLIRRSQDLLMGAGSGLFLLLCLCNGRLQKLLSAPLFQWLGTLSYSLYLIHIPIIAALAYILQAYFPLPVILFFALVFTLVLADIFQRRIAEPSAAMGKYWANIAAPLKPLASPGASIAVLA